MPKPIKKKKTKKESNGFLDNINLSEALILAAVPFAAYLIVFSYELGYFSVFKIPNEFISFDLPRIFFALFTIVIVIATTYYFGQSFINLINSWPSPIKNRLTDKVYPSVLGIVVGLFTIQDKILWIFILSLIIFINLFDFITPLFTQRNVKGYLAKLIAADKVFKGFKNRQEPSLIDKLAIIMGRRTFWGFMLFLYMLFITYQLGSGAARSQTEFRVVNTNPERVVLWIYNDYALSAPFDRVTKEVDSSFIVIKIGEDPNIEYKFEEIGPLKLKKTPPDNVSTNTPAPTPTIITTSTP